MLHEFWKNRQRSAAVKIIGVGGAGTNAVDTVISSGLTKVDLLAVNCDAEALARSRVPKRIQLGRPEQMIKRLETGGRPEIAYNAALEVGDQIFEHLVGAELVFVIAGMGGGTGTGATPVIVQLARKTQAQIIGIAIKPFTFEGQKRMEITRKSLIQLRKQVDVLITISNQTLLDKLPIGTTTAQAFKKVDKAIVKTIVDIGGVRINNQQHRKGGLYYAE